MDSNHFSISPLVLKWQIILPKSSEFFRLVSSNHTSHTQDYVCRTCVLFSWGGGITVGLRLCFFQPSKVRNRFLFWEELWTLQRPVPCSNIQKGMVLCSCISCTRWWKFLAYQMQKNKIQSNIQGKYSHHMWSFSVSLVARQRWPPWEGAMRSAFHSWNLKFDGKKQY